MANVKPFRGLRYNTKIVGSLENVTTPPYDIISPAEQEMYSNKHENSIIHLELGKTYDTDTAENNRYTRANRVLTDWMENHILTFEDTPAYYLYEEIFSLPDGSVKSLKGLISAVELVPFSEKIVLPHEETLSKAKADRFQLMDATHANFSPIYFLYMDEKKTINHIIAEISKGAPTESFQTADGITHNMWVITDEDICAAIHEAFADKQLFIADGHHRYETALNFRNKLREENPDMAKEDGGNYIMAFAVEMDDPGLVVLPTHRMLQNVENFCVDSVLDQLTQNFTVEKHTSNNVAKDAEALLAAHTDVPSFVFYTGKSEYYLLQLKNEGAMAEKLPHKSDAYRGLDVSVLHTLILDSIFGIDTDNMANQKNLVYTKFSEEAVSAVDQGVMQCSFLLNATKVRQIKDVSLLNEKMPQKSTYFYPKLITGLVVHKF